MSEENSLNRKEIIKEGNLEHKEKIFKKKWKRHKYRLSFSTWVFKIMFDMWNKNYYSDVVLKTNYDDR